MNDLFKPASNWRPPEVLINYSDSKALAIDTETYDPNLKKNGPGGFRNDGFVVGISLCDEGGRKCYLPIAHQDGGNLPKELIVSYLKNALETPKTKIFANALYDLEWLSTLGINTQGKIYDVQVAETLLNENRRSFSLDNISADYLGEQKDESLLEEAVRSHFSGRANVKSNLWRLHSSYVGPYAEKDAELTMEVFKKQHPLLKQEELLPVLDMESRMIPLLLSMRKKGVRVDIEKASKLKDTIYLKQNETQKELDTIIGSEVNVWANASIAKAYEKENIPFMHTAKGSPSFTQEWLSSAKDNISPLILRVRKLYKLRSTFIENMIIEKSVNGRLHCQLHSTGTVTGRFSSSHPNLQQVPAHDPELAPLVRGLFIPEEEHDWVCVDYAQQEPRLLVHFASKTNNESAKLAQNQYKTDTQTDFHKMVADMAGIKRKQAKTINLGLTYGMGKKKLAAELGLSFDDAESLFEKYHRNVPFVQALNNQAIAFASTKGYIKTLLGRRRHFNLFEPTGWDNFGKPAYPIEKAKEMYKGMILKRAQTHKALNCLIQGSAADVTKAAMLKVWDSNIMDIGLTIHDELDFSVPRTKEGEEKLNEVVNLMKNAVELNVPLEVDVERGASWGEIK
jgi:DNA polymerase I-like protein with 3'-5' exonuclease and polymerase domains